MNGSLVVLAGTAALAGYTYAGYPALLGLLAWRRARHTVNPGDSLVMDWPLITVVLPAFNEEAVIAEALDAILAADYPAERRQVLVISDASTDRTDAIVRAYAGRGVELVRQPRRAGKTAAENASLPFIRGDIVINTDASVRVAPAAVKALVRAMHDPAVGVASARDVSVTAGQRGSAESKYVGYEMWVRDLETATGGIVGASGCLYAIRAQVHNRPVPEGLSRDFAAALSAREAGLRAVSVPEALCFVPQTTSLRQEYRRKVRTIARGLSTLRYKRALLNPLRSGAFAWKLLSHKVCRWLLPWAGLAGLGAIGVLAAQEAWARVAVGGLVGCIVAGLLVGRRPLVFGLAANVAVLHAWVQVATGRRQATWSPTRRPLPAFAGPQHDGDRPQHDLEILPR